MKCEADCLIRLFWTQLERIATVRKYFQKVVAVQQRRGLIRSLTDANGVQLSTYDQISNEAVDFFKKLIGTADPAVSGCLRSILTKLLHVTITENAALELCKPISNEEIKGTMFSIGSDKALGPDGFSSHFFKYAWTIVGHDVIAAVTQFFQSSRLLPAFNSTNVALVPKVQNPCTIKDFRPISCCYVVYKCITKILSNRLKPHIVLSRCLYCTVLIQAFDSSCKL